MNATRKLHIGIVGAGGIVKERHLPALLKREDVEISAVCNSTYESSQRFCVEHVPAATPMKNWADLVSLPDLDVVWIGTQPYMHAPVTLSALEARKHVFCQARMAMDLAEAEEMLRAAKSRPDLVTMLCPPPHGMKGGLAFKEFLASKPIGTPIHLRLRSLSDAFVDPTKPAHWRQRRELSGLNVLTLGIYVEVLHRWFGPIASVMAQGKVVHRCREAYEVWIPDILTVLCEFQSGMLGTLEFSGVSPLPEGDRLELDGTEGKAVYDFKTETFSAGRLGETLKQVPLNGKERGWQVEKEFIEAVKSPGKPRPRPTFEDGVAYMRVVQAVANSLSTGERVML
jgi:predicted dehydrogenase